MQCLWISDRIQAGMPSRKDWALMAIQGEMPPGDQIPLRIPIPKSKKQVGLREGMYPYTG